MTFIVNNFFPFAPPSAPIPVVTYITRVQNTLSQATYTFTNVDIGSGEGLLVLIPETHDSSSFSTRVASLSVNGTNATVAVNAAANYRVGTGIFYTATTATTATIVLTPQVISPTMDGASVAVYRITNLNSNTPLQTYSNVTTPANSLSWTFTGLSENSIVIGATAVNTQRVTNWTGLTENFDVTYDTAYAVSGASNRIGTAGNSTFTRAYGTTNPTAQATVSCVWR